MSTRTIDQPKKDLHAHRGAEHHIAARVIGVLLALAVAYIHVQDQGGFPGNKAPRYIGIQYYVLEIAALAVALALLAGAGRHTLKVWALAAGVAAGPIIGYVWSRSIGMPNYTDDIGNWSEPIGLASLLVEGLLLLLAAGLFIRGRASKAR